MLWGILTLRDVTKRITIGSFDGPWTPKHLHLRWRRIGLLLNIYKCAINQWQIHLQNRKRHTCTVFLRENWISVLCQEYHIIPPWSQPTFFPSLSRIKQNPLLLSFPILCIWKTNPSTRRGCRSISGRKETRIEDQINNADPKVEIWVCFFFFLRSLEIFLSFLLLFHDILLCMCRISRSFLPGFDVPMQGSRLWRWIWGLDALHQIFLRLDPSDSCLHGVSRRFGDIPFKILLWWVF